MFIGKLALLKKAFLIIFFSLFLYFSFQTLESHIFSIHFVDEDENMIAGHYIAKGEKLYSDIFSHKQPMPAVFSALINKILKPNSLFLFIKRHREAVFFYSVFWWLIFLCEFSFSGLIFSLVIELSKRFLLGDLFLAESLVIFPLTYILGCLWKLNWEKISFHSLRKYLFLFSLILIPFQLFILIPFTVTSALYFLWKNHFNKSAFLSLFLIFMLLFLVFLPFVSYSDYFINTKSAIITHYLKDTINKGLIREFSLSFLRPLAVLFSFPKSELGIFTWFLSAAYLAGFIYLFFKERKKRAFLLFSFFLLGVISLRPEHPEATFYGGFHIFPWFASLVFLIILQIKTIILGMTNFNLLLAIFFLVLFSFNSSRFLVKDYFRKTDRERDFWVNFSRFLGLGRVIKALADEGDKLMVIPVEQLLYRESELSHQNRFLYTYEWIFKNEKLKNELKRDLENDLPAFVYYDYSSVGNDAKILLDPMFVDYIQLRQNDLPSNLLMRKDKLDGLEDRQILEIKNFDFTIPGVETENITPLR